MIDKIAITNACSAMMRPVQANNNASSKRRNSAVFTLVLVHVVREPKQWQSEVVRKLAEAPFVTPVLKTN